MTNEMNGDMLKQNQTLDSVASSYENFLQEMEGVFRRSRNNFHHVSTFNSPNVTKATLSGFLKQCIDFLVAKTEQIEELRYEVGGLQKEVWTLEEEANSLKNSTIQAQQSVISLQAELLECKDKKLEAVQSAVCNVVTESVKSEMKSYAAAATANSNHNMSPPAIKKLQRVVEQVVQAEDRSRNIVVFGLPEGDNENTNSVVDKVFEAIGEKPRHESVRVGVKKSTDSETGRHRPIKVRLSNSSHVIQILRAARKLKDTAAYRSVFLCPDRSPDERKARREAVARLKEKFRSDPDNRHFIRDGKVVTVQTG